MKVSDGRLRPKEGRVTVSGSGRRLAVAAMAAAGLLAGVTSSPGAEAAAAGTSVMPYLVAMHDTVTRGLSIADRSAAVPPSLVREMLRDATVHRYGDFHVPHSVVRQIARAAEDTGFPVEYLMAIAEKESSFHADAAARTTSAVGYMGFIEQSWLSAVKRNGSAYGLGAEADAITVSVDGNGGLRYAVEDADAEGQILELRKDAYLSSVMAALDLKAARRRIEARLSGGMGDEDLYLPHLMGEDGASRVISASIDSPTTAAAKLFPKAARTNRALFRDGRGRLLTTVEFRHRVQDVIVDRAAKYGSVAEDVARLGGVRSRKLQVLEAMASCPPLCTDY